MELNTNVLQQYIDDGVGYLSMLWVKSPKISVDFVHFLIEHFK